MRTVRKVVDELKQLKASLKRSTVWKEYVVASVSLKDELKRLRSKEWSKDHPERIKLRVAKFKAKHPDYNKIKYAETKAKLQRLEKLEAMLKKKDNK
jgi:hypothetical protein